MYVCVCVCVCVCVRVSTKMQQPTSDIQNKFWNPLQQKQWNEMNGI